MQVFNAYTNFKTFGGAELVAINLTRGLLNKNINTHLLSYTGKNKFNEKYEVEDLITYIFSYKLLVSLSKEDVIISHHRKITTKLILLKNIFNFKFRLIHVAHNEFFNFKYLTLYPKEIVAVSNKVKDNLISYFGISKERIKVIYNGIKSVESKRINDNNSSKILILLPARINKVKQQIEIVRNLIGHINDNIEIHFAGVGKDLDELKEISKHSTQFKVLGFIPISDIIHKYDYVMLYSKVEGLPTVLIEACMNSKPIICNDVGGNLEILECNKNGFFTNNYVELIQVLNSLPKRNSSDYQLLCLNSRIKYENSFMIENMIDNYYNLILHD